MCRSLKLLTPAVLWSRPSLSVYISRVFFSLLPKCLFETDMATVIYNIHVLGFISFY